MGGADACVNDEDVHAFSRRAALRDTDAREAPQGRLFRRFFQRPILIEGILLHLRLDEGHSVGVALQELVERRDQPVELREFHAALAGITRGGALITAELL